MTKEELIKQKEKLQDEMMAEIAENHLFESNGSTLDGGKKPKLKEIEDKYFPKIGEVLEKLKKFE